MSRHIHLSLDIRGAIHNRDGWKSVSSPDGRRVKKAEALAWLMERLAEGKRVLPFGSCEGFSYQTGCPGHEDSDPPHLDPHVTASGGSAATPEDRPPQPPAQQPESRLPSDDSA